jgi:glycosyltransferase involved in cell wall biosynthesis
MKVSVVINVLNGAETLEAALESALAQDEVEIEVVVWDNGSTDGTGDVVRSVQDQRIRYFRSRETVPLYAARNLAIAECTGDFVAFLDSDDWWSNDKLKKQMKLFSPNVGLVYSNFHVVNEVAGTTRRYTRRSLPAGRIYSELLKRYRVGLLTIVVRRELFRHLMFNPTLEIIGDFDFVMAIAREQEIACCQEYLGWSRFNGGNESERKKSQHLNELVMWCENKRLSGDLKGRDLRNMRRMVRAKRAEVEFESGNFARGFVEFLCVRPVGRQFKVAQRIFISRLSVRRSEKRIDGP